MTGCREAGRLLLLLFLARPTAVVPTIDRSRGGAAAWSWSILFPTIERPETTPMRWAGSGADGRWLNREREKEREVFFLARPTAVVPTIDRVVAARRRGPGQFSLRLLRDQRPRPCGGPSWSRRGRPGVRPREREREGEVFGAPDCGRSDYRPESRQRGGVVLVILFPTIERPETTPMRLSRVQSGPRLNVCR